MTKKLPTLTGRARTFRMMIEPYEHWHLFAEDGRQIDAVPEQLPRYAVIALAPGTPTDTNKTPQAVGMIYLGHDQGRIAEVVTLAIRSFYAYGGYFDLDEYPARRRVGVIDIRPEICGYTPPVNPDRLIPFMLTKTMKLVRFRDVGPHGRQVPPPDKIFRVISAVDQIDGPRVVVVEDDQHVLTVTDAMLVPLEDTLTN